MSLINLGGEEMTTFIIIGLIVVAVILLIMSFYKEDSNHEVDQKIENFSISLMKEMEHLDNKLKQLEKVVKEERHVKDLNHVVQDADAIKKQIESLSAEGHNNEEIAQAVHLPIEEVEKVMVEEKKSEVVSG
jgi:TolA-binding protein